MIIQLFLICFFINTNLFDCYQNFQKVKLTEIQALTLYGNKKYTVGRKPIPQLTCKGDKSLCYKYSPDVVQCLNQGTDGIDVQWKCKADLSKKVKFGSISVSCEGYNYPNDPYVIAGSCGLEYSLGLTDGSTSDGDFSPLWIFIGFICVFLLFIFCKSSNDNERANTYRNDYMPSAPSPPGFKTEYTKENRGYSKTNRNQEQNNHPGFWTGLFSGSALGYLFGRSNSSPSYTRSFYSPSTYTDYNYYSSSSPDYHKDKSEETYTAEGFGGTKRR